MVKLADLMKVVRAKSKLTQPALAEKAGVSLESVCKSEKNPEGMRLSTLIRIASAQGHDIGKILRFVSDKSGVGQIVQK